MKENSSRNPTRIGFIGNYLPRQCGIATFTTDVCESMASEYPLARFIAIAMNDRLEGYEYPPRVRFELAQENLADHAACGGVPEPARPGSGKPSA